MTYSLVDATTRRTHPLGMERRLVAILSADVQGYSRLMRVDETVTICTLTVYRDLMASLIQQYRGRVVDDPGDNLLAEFPSVVEAVQCAAERSKPDMWPHVITFDCYGTLVQWPETLQACFRDLLPDGADVAAFHRTFTVCHTRLCSGPYQPYSQLLQQSLREALTQWGIPADPRALAHLRTMVRAIPPYPDVPGCLTRLASHYRLGIISNTEDQLIAATVRGLVVPFEVITAEQVQAFKPDHRLFAYAFARMGCHASDVLHVGAGYPTDMVPAFELGLARIWINRRGDALDCDKPPTRELPDLTDLPACVESLVQSRQDQSHAG